MHTVALTTKQAVITQNFRKKVFYALVAGILALGMLYVYLVAATTMHIAERKDMQENIRTAHSDISVLEMEYLTLLDGIDLQRALDLGFSEAKNVQFAYSTLTDRSVALGN